jgi:hypothetical protein
MTPPDPFWRAAALALVWCLVGLGIDAGPDATSAPTPPAPNAQRAAWVPHQFASERPADGRSLLPNGGPNSPQ